MCATQLERIYCLVDHRLPISRLLPVHDILLTSGNVCAPGQDLIATAAQPPIPPENFPTTLDLVLEPKTCNDFEFDEPLPDVSISIPPSFLLLGGSGSTVLAMEGKFSMASNTDNNLLSDTSLATGWDRLVLNPNT